MNSVSILNSIKALRKLQDLRRVCREGDMSATCELVQSIQEDLPDQYVMHASGKYDVPHLLSVAEHLTGRKFEDTSFFPKDATNEDAYAEGAQRWVDALLQALPAADADQRNQIFALSLEKCNEVPGAKCWQERFPDCDTPKAVIGRLEPTKHVLEISSADAVVILSALTLYVNLGGMWVDDEKLRKHREALADGLHTTQQNPKERMIAKHRLQARGVANPTTREIEDFIEEQNRNTTQWLVRVAQSLQADPAMRAVLATVSPSGEQREQTAREQTISRLAEHIVADIVGQLEIVAKVAKLHHLATQNDTEALEVLATGVRAVATEVFGADDTPETSLIDELLEECEGALHDCNAEAMERARVMAEEEAGGNVPVVAGDGEVRKMNVAQASETKH
jgi:hypothetical protein